MADPAQHKTFGLRSAAVANGRLELVLNNTLAAIEDGRVRVLDYLARPSLDEAARSRIQVVFEELVANTIRHGFTERSDQSIHVKVDRKPDAVEFIFEDDGLPFNPLEADEPSPFTFIEDAKIGGLGISLVAKFSIRLHYERLSPADGHGDFRPNNRLMVVIPT